LRYTKLKKDALLVRSPVDAPFLLLTGMVWNPQHIFTFIIPTPKTGVVVTTNKIKNMSELWGRV
jgi:hypothetical protein